MILLAIQINGKSMIDATHDQALNELRANTTVDLVVVAEEQFEATPVCPCMPHAPHTACIVRF
jgi:hypothetical protein